MATMAGSVLSKPLAHSVFIGAAVMAALSVLTNEPLLKENQRNEREGTTLSVIVLALKASNDAEPTGVGLRSILPQIGRCLHSYIRDFDAYCRVADLQFLIVLPGITSPQASRQAEALRRGVPQLLTHHQLAMTFSTGAAGLNAGGVSIGCTTRVSADGESSALIERAHSGASQARKTGGNSVRFAPGSVAL